jgi:XTP/dITP diphosphohydrolase
LGDLLFTVVNLTHWYELDAERGLHGTLNRFSQRLEQMGAVIDRPLAEYSLAELEVLWQQAKRKLSE